MAATDADIAAKVIERLLVDPAFRAEYDALEDEFALAAALIAARARAALTQAQVAERMGTTQAGRRSPRFAPWNASRERPERAFRSALRSPRQRIRSHDTAMPFVAVSYDPLTPPRSRNRRPSPW